MSCDICSRPGAIIADDMGEIRVKKETTKVAAHFLLEDQFLGFRESSGPSHVTFASQRQIK